MIDDSPNQMMAALERVFDCLEHEARGHLSVLSNDITYWSALLPVGETDRARKRIADLCELFSLRRRLSASCKEGVGMDQQENPDLSQLMRSWAALCREASLEERSDPSDSDRGE